MLPSLPDPQIQAQALRPLKDAAAVNSTRWRLFERLKDTGLPVETGTGGMTKWNRNRRGIPKTHWLDAVKCRRQYPTSSALEIRLSPC